VICWALVTVLPSELVALAVYSSGNGVRFGMATADAWAALLYLIVVSQFIGFFFYYKGLALGGVAKMSQVQLLLPFLAIFAAHWILGEEIDGSVICGAVAITTIVVAGGRKRVGCRRVGVTASLAKATAFASVEGRAPVRSGLARPMKIGKADVPRVGQRNRTAKAKIPSRRTTPDRAGARP
jgi:uncharacterized membrane protein